MKVSLNDLPSFCQKLVSSFQSRQLVLLSGPLGAGKTQFVKACVDILHGSGSAESPTFSIINEYPGKPPIFHVDLYRLESNADVESTGFWDLFANPEGIIFVEWPEHVNEKDFPVYWKKTKIKMAFTDDAQTREISVEN